MNNLQLDNKRAFQLIEKYGSPLYVYDEKILRKRCKEVKELLKEIDFKVNYSAKANSNIELLKIIKSEGINVDAMSIGEMFVEMNAGFKAENIMFICNNVSAEEMKYAIDRNIIVSVDSLSQLELFGRINKGGKVAVRINPGVGVGHNAKVVTGGKKSKFGVELKYMDDVKRILNKYDLKLIGINQHIGSLFLEDKEYIESCKIMLDTAKQFKDLEFIDFGGGLGVPYNGENRLNLEKLSINMMKEIEKFKEEYGKDIQFKIEPGRFIVAECGLLLGTVHSVKVNYDNKYVGTDLGFNVLMRPILYNSHHDIYVYQKDVNEEKENVTIVGNICESGDMLSIDSKLPKVTESDIIGVANAGAYGYSMSSNYNCRLRPAEVLIQEDGTDRLIRKRDTLKSLINQI